MTKYILFFVIKRELNNLSAETLLPKKTTTDRQQATLRRKMGKNAGNESMNGEKKAREEK